jgi:hypothetical protein
VTYLEFVRADRLKKKFYVFGHFYSLRIGTPVFKCRSLLEIVVKSAGIERVHNNLPDAVVIMMNPGSSHPQNKDYQEAVFSIGEIESSSWKKELIPTKPDIAQYQIMRVVLIQGWDHVRVLNLSDLRNGNSRSFQRDFLRVTELCSYHPHSIFNEKRKRELIRSVMMKEGGVIIAAWGTLQILNSTAVDAIAGLKNKPLVGVKINGCSTSFRFASPYRKDHKLQWLQEITRELKKRYSSQAV